MRIISGGADPELDRRLLRELKSEIDGWDPGRPAFERIVGAGRRRLQARRRNAVAASLTVVAIGLVVFILLPAPRGAAGAVASSVFGPLVGPRPTHPVAPAHRQRDALAPGPSPQVVSPPDLHKPAPPPDEAPPGPAPLPPGPGEQATPQPDSIPQTAPPVIAGPRATPTPTSTPSSSLPSIRPTPTCPVSGICI
jgi:hypothetical protein